jgi:hypothetical protein
VGLRVGDWIPVGDVANGGIRYMGGVLDDVQVLWSKKDVLPRDPWNTLKIMRPMGNGRTLGLSTRAFSVYSDNLPSVDSAK